MSALKDAMLGDTPYMEMFAPYQAHSTTSREAAKIIAGRISGLQRRVLDYLEQHPEGATDEQLADALSLGGSTLRPRRRALQLAGRIIEHPTLNGKTKAGVSAHLWIIKPPPDRLARPKWWQPD